MKKVAGVLRQKSVELSFSSKKRKNGGSRRVLFNHNASKKEQKDMRQRIGEAKRGANDGWSEATAIHSFHI